MKKILSILIVGILSFGLIACGSTQKSNKETKKDNKQEQQETKKNDKLEQQETKKNNKPEQQETKKN
ncbi:hypothetical protein ACTQ4O_19190, partial [Clostridium sporogenes]